MRADPDYIDNKSLEYHKKIMNRASEIEIASKRNPIPRGAKHHPPEEVSGTRNNR
jgi:hypothetical protein